MIKVYIYASDGLADWEAGYIMAELNTKRFFKENAPEISVEVVGFSKRQYRTMGGMLAGALVTGVLMAIFMSNSGGAWDNAKKYVESGVHGGKGSPAHKAAVVGDTVGDPFKDTSGPSINILIKLMTVISLILAPLMASVNGGLGFISYIIK